MINKNYEKLKLLFEYTKFHIGLYTAIVVAVIALLNLADVRNFSPSSPAVSSISAV